MGFLRCMVVVVCVGVRVDVGVEVGVWGNRVRREVRWTQRWEGGVQRAASARVWIVLVVGGWWLV